ncbi:MAG: hypothetical protein AAF620_00225 [Bacteroidota bacterium]
MARSIQTIQESIIKYKDSRPELSKLNSRSSTAIWRLWTFIVAVAIYTHEVLWDFFKEEVDILLDQRIQGTAMWYSQKALEYQDGSELVVINNGTQLGYDPVIESQRLVTRAAYTESNTLQGRALILKLAKGNVSNLQKLDGIEVVRLNKYFEQIKFAGTQIFISSLDPDLLLPKMTVYHDGVFSNETIFTKVETAINNFMVSLPFDAIFYKQKFEEAVLSVANVVDVDVNNITIRSFKDILSPVDTNVDRRVILESGYLKASTTLGETFADLITIEVDV